MTVDRQTLVADLFRHPWAEEVLGWHGVHRKLYPGLPVEALRWTAGIDVDRLMVDLRAAARTYALEDSNPPEDPWTTELEPPVSVPPAPTRTHTG